MDELKNIVHNVIGNLSNQQTKNDQNEMQNQNEQNNKTEGEDLEYQNIHTNDNFHDNHNLHDTHDNHNGQSNQNIQDNQNQIVRANETDAFPTSLVARCIFLENINTEFVFSEIIEKDFFCFWHHRCSPF